jgi:hypothetical protein
MKSSTKQTTIGNLLFIIDQTMAVRKVKSEQKQSIVNSLNQMTVLDFKSFTSCIGIGFIKYSQNLINITAKIYLYIGNLQIEQVLLSPSTFSNKGGS